MAQERKAPAMSRGSLKLSGPEYQQQRTLPERMRPAILQELQKAKFHPLAAEHIKEKLRARTALDDALRDEMIDYVDYCMQENGIARVDFSESTEPVADIQAETVQSEDMYNPEREGFIQQIQENLGAIRNGELTLHEARESVIIIDRCLEDGKFEASERARYRKETMDAFAVGFLRSSLRKPLGADWRVRLDHLVAVFDKQFGKSSAFLSERMRVAAGGKEEPSESVDEIPVVTTVPGQEQPGMLHVQAYTPDVQRQELQYYRATFAPTTPVVEARPQPYTHPDTRPKEKRSPENRPENRPIEGRLLQPLDMYPPHVRDLIREYTQSIADTTQEAQQQRHGLREEFMELIRAGKTEGQRNAETTLRMVYQDLRRIRDVEHTILQQLPEPYTQEGITGCVQNMRVDLAEQQQFQQDEIDDYAQHATESEPMYEWNLKDASGGSIGSIIIFRVPLSTRDMPYYDVRFAPAVSQPVPESRKIPVTELSREPQLSRAEFAARRVNARREFKKLEDTVFRSQESARIIMRGTLEDLNTEPATTNDVFLTDLYIRYKSDFLKREKAANFKVYTNSTVTSFEVRPNDTAAEDLLQQ